MIEHASQSTCEKDECTVSKRELLRFIEAKFQMADRDGDGFLNIAELSNFLRLVCPSNSTLAAPLQLGSTGVDSDRSIFLEAQSRF